MVEQRQEVEEAEENCDMEGRDKHGEQQRQRIHLQQDTLPVVSSGCFLLHCDSLAADRDFVPTVVASRKIPAIKQLCNF